MQMIQQILILLLYSTKIASLTNSTPYIGMQHEHTQQKEHTRDCHYTPDPFGNIWIVFRLPLIALPRKHCWLRLVLRLHCELFPNLHSIFLGSALEKVTQVLKHHMWICSRDITVLIGCFAMCRSPFPLAFTERS